MRNKLINLFKRAAKNLGLHVRNADDPRFFFHSFQYLRHNGRRLEHLASLRIPVQGVKVLEVGAGIGDHSGYYLDRGCQVTITEPRPSNLDILRLRYPGADIRQVDLENMEQTKMQLKGLSFDVAHCYGLLYHIQNPAAVLEFLGGVTQGVLLLETCVSFGDASQINVVSEVQKDPTQANSGLGCRPTRSWIFEKLKELFPFVYLPVTQPNHPEFPIDWTRPELHKEPLSRAIFVASKTELTNDQLAGQLLSVQARHP